MDPAFVLSSGRELNRTRRRVNLYSTLKHIRLSFCVKVNSLTVSKRNCLTILINFFLMAHLFAGILSLWYTFVLAHLFSGILSLRLHALFCAESSC